MSNSKRYGTAAEDPVGPGLLSKSYASEAQNSCKTSRCSKEVGIDLQIVHQAKVKGI
jgi:hypothetical protein